MRKNYSKGLVKTVPSVHTGLGVVLVPMKQRENLKILGKLSIRQIMAQEQGIISSKANTGPVLPNLNSSTKQNQNVSRQYNHTPEKSSKMCIGMQN